MEKPRKPQIAVIGRDLHANEELLSETEKVGRLIAEKGGILVCGGHGGIMRAAAKGAKSEGGLTVGILPELDKNNANEYIDIAIPTGMHQARNMIIPLAADAVIALAGGVGTLSEMCLAYIYRKPIIALVGHGGWSEKLAGSYIDEKKLVKIIPAHSAEEAVELAFKIIDESKK